MSLDSTFATSPSAGEAIGGDRLIAWLLAAFAGFHLALIAFLPRAAERFMLGDRALDRTVKMQHLLSAEGVDGVLAALVRQASPGDYILFAPAYALAGPTGVMVQNTAMFLLGVLFLYKLARLFLSRHAAALAAAAWCLLPATLFHPHVFVSEAICNPLLIVATYYLARFATQERPRMRDLIVAALATAVLCFTRHIYLLLPLVFAGILAMSPRGSPRALALVVCGGYALVALWAGAATLGAKRYGPGESVGGLGSNLYLRAERMAEIGGFALPAVVDERARAAGTDLKTMQPGEFIRIAAAHPLAFARTVVSDAVNIAANPGMAMVAGRYFELFDLGEKDYRDYNKWREVRDKEGLAGLLRELWRTSPLGLVVNAAGALAWLAFVITAVIGAWKLATDRLRPLALKLLILGLPVYLLGFSSIAAGYTRWDHRSPAEFALAILFAMGVSVLAGAGKISPLPSTGRKHGKRSPDKAGA